MDDSIAYKSDLLQELWRSVQDKFEEIVTECDVTGLQIYCTAIENVSLFQ